MKYLIFVFSLSLMFMTNIYATTFDNMVIFGDSLSDAGDNQVPSETNTDADTGNNYWIESAGKTGAPITSLNPVMESHPVWDNDFISIFPDLKNKNTLEPSRKIKQLQLNPYKDNIDYAYASAESAM